MEENKIISEERMQKIFDDYYELIKSDNNARYKSWEHCYNVFSKNQNKKDDETVDLLCLNLAFYLASWGMYRSSFLLQKDYKIHKKAVLEMQKEEYNILRTFDINIFETNEFITALLKLQINLNPIYEEIKKTVKSNKKEEITDTLFTKILLGVFGCIPAYDRFLKRVLKDYGIGRSTFDNPMQIKDFITFYRVHKNIFETAQKKISSIGVEYPQMRLVDLLFWRVGLEDEGKDKPEDSLDI